MTTFQKGRKMGEQQLSVHVGPHNGVQFVDGDGETRFQIPPNREQMLRLGNQIITAALEIPGGG